MKIVLTLVHDDAGQESRIQAAIDLTRLLHGKLLCLDLTLPGEVAAHAGASDTLVLEAKPNPRVGVSARERVAACGLPHEFIGRHGTLEATVAGMAPLADIVVLTAPRADQSTATDKVIGEILVDAGKAVLTVPPDRPGVRLGGDALVLWDGSPAARRAMVAAVPLLRHASSITILEIDDGSLQLPAIQAKQLLAQHEISARIQSDLAFGEKAGWLILEQIAVLECDYVVMGGFGHARLLERVFGGVTARLLRDSPVPLFLKK